MAPELHLDPDRLHVHAGRVTALLDDLVPMPVPDAEARAVLARTDRGGAILSELDQTLAAVERAARELADLGACLYGAAARVEAADHDGAAVFLRMMWEQR